MANQVSRRGLGLGVGAAATGVFAGAISEAIRSDAEEMPRPLSLNAKQRNFGKLAESTVRVVLPDGTALGSGYHFIQPDIVVSNAHVALDARTTGTNIFAESEHGRWNLKILGSSPQDQFDFAIMRASGPGLESRSFLRPDENTDCQRGEEILYAGYPHGIEPLIVASADITSPRKGNNFFFDGMIHGGNSGGPIVSADLLLVQGTVTARRFFGDPQMMEIDREMASLQAYLQSVQGSGSVQIMGVDFTKFAYVMSRIATLTNELIRLNSTTGIGIGNSIEPVAQECRALGIA